MKTRSSLILGASIILAAIVFGIFFYQSREKDQTVQVVGYADRNFDSDIVKWTVTISKRVNFTGLEEGYTQLSYDLKHFKSIWEAKGIKSTEFKVFPVDLMDDYGNNGRVGYILTQRIYIVSNAIDEVEALATDLLPFVEQGLILSSSQLEFFSSTIDNLKVELLAEATKNARERAMKIVELTDTKVGKLLSARAGVFQITEPLSTEVAEYGIYNTGTKKKTIKVTVSASFLLK
jgi:hypothetical protein